MALLERFRPMRREEHLDALKEVQRSLDRRDERDRIERDRLYRDLEMLKQSLEIARKTESHGAR